MQTQHDIDQATVGDVIAARLGCGFVPMMVEILSYGRALESGARFAPSSSGMRALLETLDAIWRVEQHATPLPFDDTPAAFGDAIPIWLHERQIAHGIAPLPPLGGYGGGE